jgi:glycosyltransferase involved in cell wall biosynthesis
MNISVILCTYNRSESLTKALHSIAVSQMDSLALWEVLLVDNNSSDRTRQVFEEIDARYPGRFRYVFEGRPGKSYALNTGICEARGEVIAFVDDDVTVDVNWLQNLSDPLTRGDCVGVGGRVFPERDVALPSWLKLEDRYTRGPLVMFDLGPQSVPLNEPPFGTNMAFRKDIFVKYGGFRTDLGPQPGSEIRGEDSEFVDRLISGGEPLRYEPNAIVYHSIAPNRLKKEYFLAWWFDKARSDVRASRGSVDSRWRVAGIPVVLFRRILVWSLKWLLTVGSSRQFIPKLRMWYLAGEILESYRMRGRCASNQATFERHFQGYTSGNVGLTASPVRTGRSNEE